MSRTVLPHYVKVIVPSKDKSGEPLPRSVAESWLSKAEKRFCELFGGCTTYAGVGLYNPLSGELEIREDIKLVESYCTRKDYLQKIGEVERFALEMGRDMNQQSVALVTKKGMIIIEIKGG